jgi:hypothetical protein
MRFAARIRRGALPQREVPVESPRLPYLPMTGFWLGQNLELCLLNDHKRGSADPRSEACLGCVWVFANGHPGKGLTRRK